MDGIKIQVGIDLLKPHHEGRLQRTNIILFFNPILTRRFFRYE